MEQDPNTLQSKKVEQDIPLITLRPFMISDVDDFMAWASDDRVMQFFGEPRTDKEAALAHIKDDIIPHPWYRAICVDDRPVGWIFISPAPGNDHRRASMGYGLAYNHWGRGIMPAAVKKAVATIFKEWPRLERLEAFTAVENERSQRVLQKTGFQREGVLRKYAVLKGVSRDVVMFSFLSTDPILC
ncbi:uncharacterized protein [Elaeis guineensis]|uniref:uncharacterized protein n=1 Tax=Elaeis guineensis var. tenera TaxID=51953 RepID=UPI003C6CFDDD